MSKPRKPCTNCGGPKDAGGGRRICTPCTKAGAVYCPACKTVKDRSEFYPSPARPTGVQSYCKSCALVRNRDARFGLPYGTFQRMYDEQEGRCAICAEYMTTEEAHIDHDHSCCPEGGRSCGECVRALLCRGCNHGLGNFRDDPNRLIAAAAYLMQRGRVPSYSAT